MAQDTPSKTPDNKDIDALDYEDLKILAGHEKTPVDRKSGKAVAKQAASKASPSFWTDRVFKPNYTQGGTTREASHYAARIQHLHRRHTFSLGTGNREVAARKAAKIYSDIIAQGWDATLAQHCPKFAPRPERPSTVGDFIRAAEAAADVSADTLARYTASFRRIVAEIAGIDSTVKVERRTRIRDKKSGRLKYATVTETKDTKFDYSKGTRDDWLAKVDLVPLEKITPAKVQLWKVAYVRQRAAEGPLAERTARGTCNGILRNARGLFAEGIIETVRDSIALPDPLPFAGKRLLFEKSQLRSTRYSSKIDAARIVRLAVKELRANDRDAFIAFCLAIMAGMRRKEIDSLEWSDIDFETARIFVEPSNFGGVKSSESEGWIPADPEMIELLRLAKSEANGPFVVDPATMPRKTKRTTYRAERTFQRLLKWLRSKGVPPRAPIHTLRKECGSIANAAAGLHAASRFLRHSSTQITSDFYLDERQRVSTGLGAFLGGTTEESNVVDIAEGRDAG